LAIAVEKRTDFAYFLPEIAPFFTDFCRFFTIFAVILFVVVMISVFVIGLEEKDKIEKSATCLYNKVNQGESLTLSEAVFLHLQGHQLTK
jgi:hypothetical protein